MDLEIVWDSYVSQIMDSDIIFGVYACFHTTLPFHTTYTGRAHYHSDIEHCKVAQNIDVHGSSGKG